MSRAGSKGKCPGAGSRLSLACQKPEKAKCPGRCIRGEWNREVGGDRLGSQQGPGGHGEAPGATEALGRGAIGLDKFHGPLALVYRVEAGEREEAVERVLVWVLGEQTLRWG